MDASRAECLHIREIVLGGVCRPVARWEVPQAVLAQFDQILGEEIPWFVVVPGWVIQAFGYSKFPDYESVAIYPMGDARYAQWVGKTYDVPDGLEDRPVLDTGIVARVTEPEEN